MNGADVDPAVPSEAGTSMHYVEQMRDVNAAIRRIGDGFVKTITESPRG